MAEWAEEGGDGAALWRRSRHPPVSDAHRGSASGGQRYAAGVGIRRGGFRTMMHGGIEEHHNAAVHFDGIGNRDAVV